MAPPRSNTPKPGRTLVVLFVIMAVMTALMFKQGRATPKLALDLAGGTTVTLTAVTAKGETPPSAQMDKAVQIIRDRVNGLGVSESEVTKQGSNNILVGVPGENQTATLASVGATAKLQFRQVFGQTTPDTQSAPTIPEATATPGATVSPGAKTPQAVTTTPNSSPNSVPASSSAAPKGRALSEALAAPTPTPSGSATPSVSATPKTAVAPSPQVTVPSAASLGLPADTPQDVLRQYVMADCTKGDKKLPGSNDDKRPWVVSCDQNGGSKYLLGPVRVQGEQVKSAQAVPPNAQQGTLSWSVSLEFKSLGSKQFGAVTNDAYTAYQADPNAPQAQVAIVLDGQTVSAPQISQGPIYGGTASIDGPPDSFTQQYATDLANVLNYGALPLEFTKSSVETVSSTLGSDQLRGGLLAGAIGLGLVIICSLMYYRGLGIVSVLSLAVAGALIWLSVVVLGENIGFRLSLAHIIGLIVAIGITADSFIVYFERLRDELRQGRPLRPSVEKAWRRARRTILVADAVTFIAAVVLYLLAVGGVAGFAFAMGLTTIIDLVVVFFFTKPLVTLLARKRFFAKGHRLSGLDPVQLRGNAPARTATERAGGQRPGIRKTIARIYRGDAKANIVGRPKVWYSLSAALIVISILALGTRWLNFGVEFTGGSVFTFKAPHATVQDVRATVGNAGPHEVIVQSASEAGWRVTTETLPVEEAVKVEAAITQHYHLSKGQVSSQVIGSTWGGEVSSKAWLSLIVFMVLISVYLSVAFEWRMAVAATVALVHDLVITAGVYALSGFEVTPATLLGFLTILGYSLYDAVVVFDMIKEETKELGTSKMMTYSEAANSALNRTLVRSLNTSLVALLPVAAILFIGTTLFGAGTLKDLSLSLFVGILVGTYSSICVATPLLVQLKEREPRYQQLRARLAKRESSSKRQAKTAKVAVLASVAVSDDVSGDASPETAARKVVQQGPRQQPKKGTRRERR